MRLIICRSLWILALLTVSVLAVTFMINLCFVFYFLGIGSFMVQALWSFEWALCCFIASILILLGAGFGLFIHTKKFIKDIKLYRADKAGFNEKFCKGELIKTPTNNIIIAAFFLTLFFLFMFITGITIDKMDLDLFNIKATTESVISVVVYTILATLTFLSSVFFSYKSIRKIAERIKKNKVKQSTL